VVHFRIVRTLNADEAKPWSLTNSCRGPQDWPFDLVRVADLGDAWIERPFELQGALAEIAAFFGTVHAAGVTPLSVGGDHSISLPILRAIARDGPLGMVHVDAHCDTGDDYLGSRFHHGAPFRRAVEEGLIDPKRVVQIGIRGSLSVADMWQFSYDSGMRVISIEEFQDKGWRWAAREVREVTGGRPTYLSFDVDSLDPVYAPGTGTPEPGGLTTLEAQRLIRDLGGLDFVGADLVEVSPPHTSPSAQYNCLAKGTMYMPTKIPALFMADSVMLGLSARKLEASPIKADRIRVTYAGWDPPRLARMAAIGGPRTAVLSIRAGGRGCGVPT
jgi:agmatinase